HYNLQPGRPLHYQSDGTEAEENWTLQTPGSRPRNLLFGAGPPSLEILHAAREDGSGLSAATKPIVDYQGTWHTGVYTLRIPKKDDWMAPEICQFFDGVLSAKRVVYYTIQATDPTEFDLTPLSAEDRARVANLVSVSYESDGEDLLKNLAEEANTQ